jgi:sterol desaturase/sphingolipid hydroxylase (fatty acid hydroxylase superfamily)
VTLPLVLLGILLSRDWEVDLSFREDDLPDTKKLLASVAFCMMCEDMAFYLAHKFLHWKLIYPYIHKIHHEHRTTFQLAAEHAHPIEFILGNALPAGFGSLLLGNKMHFATHIIWTILRVGETIEGHSGYEFSWSPYKLIPFMPSNTYHDYHHSHNVGNYVSQFLIWDLVFGDNQEYYKYIKKKQQSI